MVDAYVWRHEMHGIQKTGAAYAVGFGLFLLAAMLIGLNVKMLIALPLLFAVSVYSLNYRRIFPVPPAFELVTLTTVVVGMTYGPLFGAVYGFFVAIAAEVFSGGVSSFLLAYAPARALQGAVAAFFAGFGIAFAGVALTILYNIPAQALCFLQGDAEIKLKAAIYVVFNVAINAAIFKAFGMPLLGAIS